MPFPKITEQQVKTLVQDPKNYLLVPAIFLGNALPFFFQSLARGAYIDIINRSTFTVLDHSLTTKLTHLIHPQGEKIRKAFGDRVDQLISELNYSAKWTIKSVILPLFGLDPNSLFSDKALVKTALSTAALATALFATSALTGSGVLPLFWTYQNMRVVRSAAAFAIDIYQFPNHHPLVCRAISFIRSQIN